MGFTPENFDSGITYQAQEKDTFIVTYPKCGTTWTQHIIWMLSHDGKPLPLDKNINLEVPHLEEVGGDFVKYLSKPRFIKTHLINFIDKYILIGREINQNLSRGQIIKVRHLKERFTVVEGQAIIIYADLNGINVKMDGNALQNGHLNEWIKVRNNSSGKVVEGKIINEKKILINF